MAVPVELEIFMKDLTKAGLQSVGKNVDDVENQTLQLISALKQVIAEQKHQLEVNKAAGISYTQETANIQALTGQVRGLEAGLKSLKKTKEETAKTQTIDIDTEAVTRKTNNLKMQFSQVARELPSLAMGPQMFILAISNNLPMLADAISDVRKQNELLAASGQKGVPVWKQLAGALFSWQTGLITAITLMIAFNKQISEFTAKLFKGKEAALSLSDAQKNISEEFSKSSGDLGEQIVRIRTLSERWNELGEDLSAKKKFIRENREELDKIPVSISNITEAENLLGQGTDAYIQAMSLRAQAAIAFKKASEEAVKSQEVQMKIDKEKNSGPSFWDKVLAAMASTSSGTYYSSRASTPVSSQEIQNERIKSLEEEKSAAEETEKAYRDLFKTLSDEAKKTLDNAGISGKTTDDKTGSRRDYASELADARVKAQQTTEKLRIQIMQEGIAKRMALAKQEYDDSIADIDKQERDTLAKMDKARKQGDNIPQSQYDAVKESAKNNRVLAEQVYNEQIYQIEQEYRDKATQSLIDYNKQYGTYQEKRLAIAMDYARKIAAAETEGEADVLTRERDDKLASLDFEEMKKGMDWDKIFGDLDRVSTDTLESLRKKLKEYLEGIGDDISPESFKEVMDAFKNIDSELADRSPFEAMKKGYEDYKSAMEEVRTAQNLLQQAQMGGSVIVEEYDEATGTLTRKLITQAEAEERLRAAQDKRYSAQKNLTEAANSIGQKGMAIVDAGNDIVDMLGNLGVKVPEAVSETLNGVSQVMNGLESIDLTNPFSAISGVTKVLTGVGNTIAGLFGFGGADYSGYENLKSKYEGLIDIWDSLISKKQQYIDIDYGVEAQKAAEEAKKLVDVQIARQRQLAIMLAGSGASIGSHSLGYRVNDRMSSQDWQRLSGLVGEQVGSLGDVLGLDAGIIGNVLQDEKFVSVLTDVNSEFIDYIQNIGSYADQLEEIASKEQEAITGIGFDAFKDGYFDLISDLESTNEDLADNLEKNLQNAFFRSLIANKYNSQIKALYDNWVKLGEDGLTRDEVDNLREQNQAMVDQMIKDREELMNTFGWSASGSGSSQSPGSGALTTMSQESISTFEGIGRNMQTHLANIDKFVQDLRESQKLDSETLATIASHTAYIVLIYDLMEDMKLNGIKMQ
ncbi:hypothetical protein [Phocaeicola coprophilus]|uniref:hypothetical protein n=1 Tax=Phocaeicola coprophilus TaxID=387090 RepID=UPI003994DC7B